jgi:hypothetical protein
MTRSDQLMQRVRANLDENGCIDRREVQRMAADFGLHSVNHLYGTSYPKMIQVPGTNLGRLAKP